MSYVPVIPVDHKKHQQKEEEQMTGYHTDDLEGWEFKIVRAFMRKFRNPETIRKLCEEEAQAGWEMLEKFDDERIRFKRRIEKRSNDQYLKIDPYRTQCGIDQKILIAFILASLGALGLIFAIMRH